MEVDLGVLLVVAFCLDSTAVRPSLDFILHRHPFCYCETQSSALHP